MAMNETCPLWHPGECTGTPACPPRCPRFATGDGSRYTIRPVRLEGRRLEVRDEDGAVCGRAFAPFGAPAHVEVASEVQSEVAAEVIRQVVAHAYARGEDAIEVVATADAVTHVSKELGSAARSDGASLHVTLDTETVARLLLPPARYAPVGAPTGLDALVDPAKVAVIGATDREGSIGRVLLENLLATFDGEVIPVHPTASTLLGVEAMMMDELGRYSPDLTVIALPADDVLDAVRCALDAGTSAIAIVSAGFGEADEVGARRERELRDLLEGHEVTVIGPNALGVVSLRRGLNASFAPVIPPDGGVSVVSHSGAMITAILDWLHGADIGIRDVLSLGNTVDLDVPEVLRYWGHDPETDVIVAYLEDVRDGRGFVEAARDVTPTTPVIAIKGGRTEAGSAAAASHTGALVGDVAGFDAAFDAAGVVTVDGQQALFDVLQAIDRQPVPTGSRLGVVTNAGGPGVLAADAVAVSRCDLAGLTASTLERLGETLPSAATPGNPVDVLGDADIDRITSALEVVLSDGGVDAGIVTTTPHPLIDQGDLIDGVGDVAMRYGKPVVICLGGRTPSASVAQAAREASVPLYPDIARAVSTLATLARYGEVRRRPRLTPSPVSVDVERVTSVLELAEGNTLGVEASGLLEAYGVSTPWWNAVDRLDEVDHVLEGRTGPFVLKLAGLAHKTEVDGVVTGVMAEEVPAVADELLECGDTVIVQEQVEDGIEVLVGVTTHPRFGPVLTVGLGGTFVEQLDDVQHALAPVTHPEVEDLLGNLDAASLIETGPRGGRPPDRDALVDAIVRVSQLGSDIDAIGELEVNPLIATSEGAFAVDLVAQLTD